MFFVNVTGNLPLPALTRPGWFRKSAQHAEAPSLPAKGQVHVPRAGGPVVCRMLTGAFEIPEGEAKVLGAEVPQEDLQRMPAQHQAQTPGPTFPVPAPTFSSICIPGYSKQATAPFSRIPFLFIHLLYRTCGVERD